MYYITTDAFPKIAYRKTGSGPVLVLLHGFPENGKLWNNIVPSLSDSFTNIIPDFPGSGESDFIGVDLSIEQLADSVKAILDHEKMSKAVLAGHSMGGYAALAFADKYPAMVAGISMIHSTATADDDEKKEVRRKSINIIQKGAKETFTKQLVPNLFSSVFVENNNDLVQQQVEESLKLPGESMVAFYNAMLRRPDWQNVVVKSQFPLQWIIGKNDNVIPFNKALQQSHLADINFVSVYDNCGHMSMIEQPQRLANDLNHFINYCYNQ